MRAAYTALKPSECWDWMQFEDLYRITRQALKLARANCYPPRGEVFLSGDGPWSSPRDFADTLVELLVLHVRADAHAKGVPGNELVPAQLSLWYPDPGAGRSPALKGHGCPAFDVGAGRAATSSERSDERGEVPN
jgi:hypothetical protein